MGVGSLVGGSLSRDPCSVLVGMDAHVPLPRGESGGAVTDSMAALRSIMAN